MYLAVILFLDYHGAGSKVAHSLAVFIVKSNATEQKSFGLELYDRVNKDKNKNDKLAYSNSGLIGHSYFYHGRCV